MATTLQTSGGSSVTWDFQNPGDLSTCVAKSGASFSQTFLSTNNGATKTSKMYEKIISITNGAANTTFNFASFVDVFGTTQNMTKCRIIYMECTSGTGNLRFTTGHALPLALYGVSTGTVKPITSGQQVHEQAATTAGLDSTSSTIIFQNTNTGSTFTCKVFFAGE